LGRLLPTGICDNRPLERVMARLFSTHGRSNDFRKLVPRLYVVATELNTGHSVRFGEAGYESLRLNGIRTVRAAACVPPNGCQISRVDCSFKEDLWTIGVGAEWALTDARIHWGWPLVAALVFVAVGPSVLAYRCWNIVLQRTGPAMAGFFSKLTPLFAALIWAVWTGETPQAYHALAFLLIAGGIVVSSRR
jgi:hypothetical protein